MRADLSIILVSYNSLNDLQRCLPTIRKQRLSFTFELIVVDNHGRDGVAEWLKKDWPDVKLVTNPTNSGYAGGNNLGARHAESPWLFLLNPDTELHPTCLEQLMTTARQYPNSLLNPKLLNADGTVNACGNQMHYTGITTCRGLNQPSSRYQDLEDVPLLSGAAIWCSAGTFGELNGFEENFFMYYEDTDLSLRARRLGYRLLCDARAVLTHHYSLQMNAQKFYFLERNRLFCLLTLLNRSTLRQLMPALFLTELMTWAYALTRVSYLKSRFRGYAWLWHNRRLLRQRRVTVRLGATADDAVLLHGATSELPLTQLVSALPGRVLTKISRFIFNALRPQSIVQLL